MNAFHTSKARCERAWLLPVSFCLLLLTATTAVAESMPAIPAGAISPFEATFDVGNNVITAGSARLSLQRDGDEWVYSLSTKPKGVFKLTGKGKIKEISIMDVIAEGDTVRLQPKRYSYRQDKEKRRSVDAMFDWQAKQLTYQHRGKESTLTLDGPVLDRLSVTLQAMGSLQQGYKQADVSVFDKSKLKTMEFINEGTETLKTRMGTVETIRVRSRNKDSGRRQTLTWFAPSFDYVPVKIEQLKRGELVARMTLTGLKNPSTDVAAEEESN